MTKQFFFLKVSLLILAINSVFSKHARFIVHPEKLGEEKIMYLTKMYLHDGGTLELNTHLRFGNTGEGENTSSYKVLLYDHNVFNSIQKTELSCAQKEELSFSNTTLLVKSHDLIPFTAKLDVPASHNTSREVVFLIASNCDDGLSSVRTKDRIVLDVDILSHTGGHLDSHHHSLYSTHCILGLILIFLYVPLIRKFYLTVKNQNSETEDTSSVYMAVNSCLILKCFSFLVNFLELQVLSSTGIASFALAIIGHGANYLCQYSLCCLLIFLASGWSTFIDSAFDFEGLVSISITVGMLKIMVVIVSEILGKGPDLHHRYDSWIGVVLALI